MGKYVLNNIALRSWWLVPYAYVSDINGEQRRVRKVPKGLYDLLVKCDGITELPDSEALSSLLRNGLIRPAADGEVTDPFLMPRSYDNRYVLTMGINITERCNFNCRHCYEAADNEIPRNEISYEDCEKLIKQARECGVQNVKITGGEPLMHRDFMKILRAVYDNEMTVDRINTNGFFINEKLLDEIRSIDPNILFNVSYDGAGFHDWMRGREGAEKDILSKIQLLSDKGFYTRAAMTLNRVNLNAASETMHKLDSLGVREFRIIRTSETPRWVLNAGDACLTMEEYYDSMVELCREYAASDLKIALNVWHFVKVLSSSHQYFMFPITCGYDEYDPLMPLCGNARENITIVPGGNVYPCTPSPGLYKAAGIEFGNVFDSGLKSILQNSDYLSFVCKGVHAIEENDPKCAACQYFRQCHGGCRLFGLGIGGGLLGHDPTKCLFFEGRYDEKLRDALPGYTTAQKVVRTE